MTNDEMKEWMETQYDVDDNGCWIWKGVIVRGYGFVGWHRKDVRVHRLYWLLSGNTIPDGYDMCHGPGCSTACFNPEHLVPGTKQKNSLDKHRDGTMITKLTKEQVLEIRARTDRSMRELGREYGVNHRTIGDIIHRKIWAWL